MCKRLAVSYILLHALQTYHTEGMDNNFVLGQYFFLNLFKARQKYYSTKKRVKTYYPMVQGLQCSSWEIHFTYTLTVPLSTYVDNACNPVMDKYPIQGGWDTQGLSPEFILLIHNNVCHVIGIRELLTWEGGNLLA